MAVGCKKEDSSPNSSAFSMPRSVGTNWTYEWVKVDANGVETAMNITETVTILGDSLINGNSYTVYESSIVNQNQSPQLSYKFYRDSLGFIVDLQGRIQLNTQLFEVVVDTGTDEVFPEWNLMMHKNIPVTTPVGEFHSIDATKTYFNSNGSPITSCGSLEVKTNAYFVSGIGKVKEVTGLYSELYNCSSTLEIRLMDYHIQ